jgi:hypothetical protein
MATKKGNVRVTFGNRWTGFDGREYEQGKTYSVPEGTARHLLASGKVRRAEDEQTPVAVSQNNNGATVAPADK